VGSGGGFSSLPPLPERSFCRFPPKVWQRESVCVAKRYRYSSSARIFEQRGDPWLTDKEQRKDFQRDPEAENPDYDFDHRFHYTQNAKGKPKTVAPRNDGPNVISRGNADAAPDFSKRGANLLAKLHRQNAAVRVQANEKPQRFVLCAGCRKALCAARGRCAFPAGRKE
jgi:hypothetical protein